MTLLDEGQVAGPETSSASGADSTPDLQEEFAADAGPAEAGEPPLRAAVAVAFPSLATAVMVGGMFTGFHARVYAGVAGLLGIGLAMVARKLRPPLSTVAIVAGLFAIGLLMMVPSGVESIFSVRRLVASAAASGDVLRPPVDLSAGWQAIIGWIMAIVGFTAAWVALVLAKPAGGLLVPLPIAALAGISVPKDAQVGSGIAVLALFAIGLVVVAGTPADADEVRRPLGYEVRRAAKGIPLIAVITVLMYVLAQSNVLFPRPLIDPTQEPQKPKTTPLSEVPDRVLAEVESSVSGPWRMGSLDEYDGVDWRLPAFAQNRLEDVPRSGVVDPDLEPGVRATFTVLGLGGAVLPSLPNTVGIVAQGPALAYDSRNGNIRTAQGQVRPGLVYTVTAASVPSVDALKAVTAPLPAELSRFTRIPDMPPGVADLVAQAPTTSQWEKFDFLRSHILDTIVAVGTGTPKSVTPARIDEMLATREGSPFEIVAAQAMLARWIGLASRIGYGFDGGDEVGGKLQIRPRHGATFVEVYFPGYKWLPVIGTPATARPSVGGDSREQQFDPSVLPSDNIAVQVFLQEVQPPQSVFLEQVRLAVLLVLLGLLIATLLYFTYPAVAKAARRARRRSAAAAAGPRAKVALAYSEWRDTATDFGYGYPTDTPIMFLDRVIDDAEHRQLAWLVTRTLWGDLREDPTPEMAAYASELARSLRRRLAMAHPATIRFIAAISRLSLRQPYGVSDAGNKEEKGRHDSVEAA